MESKTIFTGLGKSSHCVGFAADIRGMALSGKRTLVHINMHVVAANKKNATTNPVITIKTYNSNVYAHEAAVLGADGTAVLRVVYRPDAPLPSGGTVWIEVYQPVSVTDGESDAYGDGGAALTLPGSPDSPVVLTVSRPAIRSNIHRDAARSIAPILTAAHPSLSGPVSGSEAVMRAIDGTPLAEVVYRPESPLSCGARLWVQTNQQVEPTIRPDLLALASTAA